MTLDEAVAEIQAAFRAATGRDISPEEVRRDHLSGGRFFGPENVDAAIMAIQNSPEAQAYQQAQEAPSDTVDHTVSDPFTTRPSAGDFGRTEGFDQGNWGSMDSIKYRAGEILARYPPTPEGLKQAMDDPDFKKLFPNAKLSGFDTIDFGGQMSDFNRGVPVGRVDVGRSFDPSSNSGAAWVWQDLQNTQAPGAAASPGATSDWRVKSPTTFATPVGTPPGTSTTQPTGDVSLADLAATQTAPPPTDPAMNPNDVYLSDLAKARNQRIRPGGFA